jgi:hypothetical protein
LKRVQQFGVFECLHWGEFEATGIGLAAVLDGSPL